MPTGDDGGERDDGGFPFDGDLPFDGPNFGQLERIYVSPDRRGLTFRFRPTWIRTSFYVDYDLNRVMLP